MTYKKLFLIGLIISFGCLILGGVIGASVAIFENYFPNGYIVFPYDFLYALLFLVIGSLFIFFLKNLVKYKHLQRMQHANDEDRVAALLEKTCFTLLYSTSFMIVVSFMWLAIAVGHFKAGPPQEQFWFVTLNTIAAGLSFVLTGVAQYYAVKIHNKQFPDRRYNIFSPDPQKEYFKQLDEGEKFLTYQASFSVFRKMTFVFCFALGGLLCYGSFVQFHIVPILLVGGLWLTMYIIHYQESKKQFSVEG
ncbi:hypothetical protein FIU87_04705 [Bacillus sp. THAF10]|uniref:DUF3169 family protein n=1 Tax=Bacillus sp. THAF10 TaxID=2587848 RepID=UPI001268E742|nr:DUF3169 family protein [Bacillus sp. THAF10]QFT87949.1 hypothetical protein FIU87_04705 [Bacillus sp. THAF10]